MTDYLKLVQLVDKSNRKEDVDPSWLKDEMYAIEWLKIADQFLNMVESGKKYDNQENSSVAYILGVTDIAPDSSPRSLVIHSGRISPPDVDLDFDDRRRHEVIQYARDKYGSDRVAHIGTFSRVKAKSAIKDVARVLGYDFTLPNELTKLMPKPVFGKEATIDESIEKSAEFRKRYESDEEVKKIVDYAKELEGIYRQTGIHAAGVVIGRSSITDFVPVMQRPDKEGNPGLVVTQWDMNRVEECGLLKVDFLGLTNLGTIDICVENIRNTRSEEVDVEALPLEDSLTYKRLCDGESKGVFQVESGGMQEMMVSLQPTRIEDIMALISLYRPGPLGSGIDKMFINGKHGRANTGGDHPIMDELLEPTYGFMLYQEDVLSVARNVAGFTAAEADDLRKAIGKKKMDTIGEFRDKFVQGCIDTNNIPAKIANKIYSDIEYFGGYGFNLAHAASYAMVSYVTAYLKFNYPAEYMAALLTTTKTQNELASYLNECKNMDIEVLPPSINRSLSEFKVEDSSTVLYGLASVKGIGPAIVDYIMSTRTSEYSSIYDFMRRCDVEILNKAVLEHLSRAGAFDELVPPQEEILISREDKMEFLDEERAELGFYITENPLSGVWHIIEPLITHTIEELNNVPEGDTVAIGGLLSSVDKKTTRRGQVMYILQLDDLTGSITVIVFPGAVKDYEFIEGSIVTIRGKTAQEGEEEFFVTKLYFENMQYPKVPEFDYGDPIVISFKDIPDFDTIKRINDVIQSKPGNRLVTMTFRDAGYEIVTQFNRPASSEIEDDLQFLSRSQINV